MAARPAPARRCPGPLLAKRSGEGAAGKRGGESDEEPGERGRGQAEDGPLSLSSLFLFPIPGSASSHRRRAAPEAPARAASAVYLEVPDRAGRRAKEADARALRVAPRCPASGTEQCPEALCVEGQCAYTAAPCPLPCEQICNLISCILCWDGSEACQVGQCIDEQCVLVGNDCPPKPSCDPVQAKGQGPCAEVLGFVWDGEDCTGIAGCACAGEGCAQVVATYEQCAAERAHCASSCQGKLCGEFCEECGDGGCFGGQCDGDGVCAGPTPCP